MKLKAPDGKITLIGGQLNLEKSSMAETAFFVEIDKNNIYGTNSMITIEIYSGDELLEEINSNFMGPSQEQNE